MTTIDPTLVDAANPRAATSITPGVTPVLVPAERYRSPDFAERERSALWPHVWQVACTVSHVPSAGDFFEFRCGQLSVIIVRDDDGGLRAYQNVCRHRGNSICQGGGSGLTELRCPFHRWAWDLEGALREVPSRKAFGEGFDNADFGLFPVAIDSWGPLVFINLNPDAAPLTDWLEAVPDDAAWSRPDEYRCATAITVPVEANWKVVAEGFSETYHVQGIHRELLATMDDVHAPQVVWGHHSVSYQAYGVPNPRAGQDTSDQAVWDAFVLTQGGRMDVPEPCEVPAVPAGSTITDVIADRIRAAEAAKGVDLTGFDTAQITSLSQYNLFPNTTVLISADMWSTLVARPGPTPDSAFFTMYNCRRNDGSPAARIDEYVIPAETDLGTVMSQDMNLLRTAQLGLQQPGLTHLAVGAEEPRIINLHRNLESWLGISPTELIPITPKNPQGV